MSATTDKPRYPRAQALAVTREILSYLQPLCERLIIAGSLRRRKESVGDVEILYIPKFKTVPSLQQADLLSGPPEPQHFNLSDATIAGLAGWYKNKKGEREQAADYIIQPRRTSAGSWTWGPKNKLARHVASGIPIDFFSATEANWFNLLVGRTGSADNNVRLASAAQKKGWQWNPYGVGFTDQEGNPVPVTSEQDVYRLAGLPYLEPWQR